MKKKIKVILLIAVLVLVGWIGSNIYNKVQAKRMAEKNTAVLPAFTFSTLDGHPFDNTAIVRSNVIINYFNPECEHCRAMAQSYVQYATALKNVQILMITVADSAAVAKFSADYRLEHQPYITLLLDKKFQFQTIFGTGVVPSFFIYGDKKLVRKIMGETRIRNLLNE